MNRNLANPATISFEMEIGEVENIIVALGLLYTETRDSEVRRTLAYVEAKKQQKTRGRRDTRPVLQTRPETRLSPAVRGGLRRCTVGLRSRQCAYRG